MITAAWILLSLFCLLEGQNSFLFLGPGEGSDQSEVLSLPLGDAPACGLTIEPYPVINGYSVEGPVGFLQGGLITVCGGGSPACLSLHPFLGIWEEIISPLPYNVYGGGAITLANGDTMVLGTFHEMEKLPQGPGTGSFIFRQETGEWIPGPSLPYPSVLAVSGFCTVQMNTTHSLIIGGYIYDYEDDSEVWTSDVHIFDGETFTQVSSLKEPRSELGCALSSNGNIIVAGGNTEPGEGGDPDGEPIDSVEIYDPLADTWTPGPLLPKPLAWFAGMAADGDKMLLIGGGGGGYGYERDIYSLLPGAEQWELEDTKLENGLGGGPQPIRVTLDNLNC